MVYVVWFACLVTYIGCHVTVHLTAFTLHQQGCLRDSTLRASPRGKHLRGLLRQCFTKMFYICMISYNKHIGLLIRENIITSGCLI
jgi:hypothetical protein